MGQRFHRNTNILYYQNFHRLNFGCKHDLTKREVSWLVCTRNACNRDFCQVVQCGALTEKTIMERAMEAFVKYQTEASGSRR